MAMLASKSPYPAPLSSVSSQSSASMQPSSNSTGRKVAQNVSMSNQQLASPTESEFSDSVDAPDSARNWDEQRVCDWLHTVNSGQYEKAFRRNNINGENLLELDKEGLKEIGVEKIGDRVRLFVGIKALRTKAYANTKKRNRDSFAALESSSFAYTPSSSGSPRPPNSASRTVPTPTVNKRYSRQMDGYNPATAIPENVSKQPSRPSSPLASDQLRSARQPKYGLVSPAEHARREQTPGYFYGSNGTPTSASTTSSRLPPTPLKTQQQPTRNDHNRRNGSIDNSLMSALPPDQDVIRVISTDGVTKVVKITGCANCDEVMRLTLRKFNFREDHDRNYCFYVLDGVEPDPLNCRRLYEHELWDIVRDMKRPERNRLILRKIHAGEPGDAELNRAAAIAMQEVSANHTKALESIDNKRSQMKVQKVLGEGWDGSLQHPISPVSIHSTTSALSATERERNVYNAAKDLERPEPVEHPKEVKPQARKKGVLRQYFGQRPPSELITSDLISYFPDHSREEIDRTARMSLRRSARLSRMNSRLSVASNFSTASSLRDAPPMPTIADTWLQGQNQISKPRSVSSRASSHYQRDSVASSMMLERVQEESAPTASGDIRASYVSMSYDSGSDKGALHVTDPDGHITQHSYFDDGSTEGASSIYDISRALGSDGEDPDAELTSFLAGDSWDDSKWMQGALIGQGSFGSVYLALHAVTGELLAVKQVEAPSPGGNSQMDAKKKSMIDALKREIGLLRDLQHPNIVQYLGASSSADRLNIFLEYVPGGSVQSMLNQYGALREPLIRSFVRQIVTGLAYLHGRGIIHRDIKGANILVDNKGTIKISDFGISKKQEATNILNGAGNSKHRPSLQGSVFWMAPEVVKQISNTTLKADIWSLGCLVVEMMTGSHPFPDCSQLQAIFRLGGPKACPTIPEHASPDAKTFLSQTFELDFEKRPTADELLLSPFLNPIT